MSHYCFHCSEPIVVTADRHIGRSEQCPRCGSDLHCCKNCQHYSPSAYNECNEPQAERVLTKDRANFCDYFSFGTRGGGKAPDKSDALKKLDDLFKK